jgi:GT2 family glycosyltransferase
MNTTDSARSELKQNEPLLSVCIVTYGRRKDDLLKAVASVYAYAADMTFEIIIVDNGSADDALEQLEKKPFLTVIRNGENLGYAPAMNLALGRSKGKYVLCLSLDAELLRNSVQTLIHFMDRHPQCGLAGPRTVNGEGEVLTTRHHPNLMLSMWGEIIPVKMWLRNNRFIRRAASVVLPNTCGLTSDYNQTQSVRLLSGGILLSSRRFLDDVGLLDGNMPLGPDDYDWCHRARHKGYEIWYVAESTMIHRQKPKEDATKLAPINLFSQLPSVLYFYRKNHSGLEFRVFQASILLLLTKWRWKVLRTHGANSVYYEAIKAANRICLKPGYFEEEVSRKWALQCERFRPST